MWELFHSPIPNYKPILGTALTRKHSHTFKQIFDGTYYEDNFIHAHINIGIYWLMLADTFPGQNIQPDSTITIMVDLKEEADAKGSLRSCLLEEGEKLR